MKYYTMLFIITVLFCYLFANIVISKTVKNDEEVIFIPVYGKIIKDVISAEIHMWIFEPEENSIVRNIITSAMKKLFISDEEFQDSEIFKSRLRPFMADNERNKKLTVLINGQKFELKASSADGHSLTKITIPVESENQNNAILKINLDTSVPNQRQFESYITVVKPDGLSVISDIDDTIKISNVLNKKELIKNTFIRPFAPVEKTPEFYSHLANQNVSFHYVSGSPWQLFKSISSFMQQAGFPKGSFHLKKFRVVDKSFIDFIIADQKEYKTDIISRIIDDFPEKKFILIGDSGEMDAEIYSGIFKKYPENVKAVFIRDAGNLALEQDRFKAIQNNFTSIIFSFFIDGNDLIKFSSELIAK